MCSYVELSPFHERTFLYNPIPVYFVFVSELAGPQQDVQGAGGGRERDPPA